MVQPFDRQNNLRKAHSFRFIFSIVHSTVQPGRGALPGGYGGTRSLRQALTLEPCATKAMHVPKTSPRSEIKVTGVHPHCDAIGRSLGSVASQPRRWGFAALPFQNRIALPERADS